MSEDAVSGGAKRWDVPTIDGSQGQGMPTAGRLQALQQQAWDEAFKKGHAEGLAAGEAAARQRAERLDTLLHALARPFDELDEQIEKQLVDLAMAVVRQLFRREIQLEPTHIVGVVREAIQLLPIASSNVCLHLNPDDAAVIRELLAPADGEPAWSITEDPLIERGGCKVTTDNSQVDATAAARLKSLIASVVGDQRR